MNNYEAPNMEIIVCEAEDLLRTSAETEDGELGENMTPIG